MLIYLLSLVSGMKLDLHRKSSQLFDSFPDANLAKIFNYYNSYYYTNLKIGTPWSELSVMIDTGSPILWFPDYDCETCTHTSKYYYPKNSTSSVSLSKQYSLKIGGNNVTGMAYLDRVEIENNQTAENLFVLSVTKKFGYKHLPSDGVLGLSLGNRPPGYKSIVEVVHNQSKIKEPFFALYLSDHLLGVMADTNPQAQITIGKYDKSLADSNFTYVRVFPNSGAWLSNISGIEIEKVRSPLSSNFVIFSTSSPLIQGPKSDIDKIIQKIVKKSYCYLFEGYKVCSCKDLNSYPVLKFVIDGKEFELGPEFYAVAASGWCVLQIKGDARMKYFVLGLPFLRKYYSLYSFDKGVVGFAIAKSAEIIVSSSGFEWSGVVVGLVGATIMFILFKIYYKKSKIYGPETTEHLNYVRL